ncbi:zinc finger protein aebp2-like isoform X2 [Xenopus laevis]|uniref:Zinc finger protein aebp2-like isoform X2 n=1 Tax=Xenopus laevis TaxID=8355 RepID=A0A8J1MKY4_XENLA|nr:zinc finger protein aebp2-like isoform X2 [Xenopus laevis]
MSLPGHHSACCRSLRPSPAPSLREASELRDKMAAASACPEPSDPPAGSSSPPAAQPELPPPVEEGDEADDESSRSSGSERPDSPSGQESQGPGVGGSSSSSSSSSSSGLGSMTVSEAEPLSRMDSEDSISSTLMDVDSTVSSGRSTPAMMNGGLANKNPSYSCCWDHCQTPFSCSPDLADHIRSVHVDGQHGGVYVCYWKGCKVYNTPSTSHSWLHRHMLTHSGDKPFKCVVGGCNASFASQGGLARHVPTHFSQQNSSKMANHSKSKEESPSKAGLNRKRKLKIKRKRTLPRPHDFFDAQTLDAIRHRAICFNLSAQIESLGNGHSVVFHSTVVAKRKEDTGKIKLLLHWTPEDILPDVWVNESDRHQLKTKVVHLSKLPKDTALLLDPNIYRNSSKRNEPSGTLKEQVS